MTDSVVDVCVRVESDTTSVFAAAEHPFEERRSAVRLVAITFQPQPEMVTSPASRLSISTTVEVAGSPVMVKSPTDISLNVPGWRLRIIMFPAVTSSKIALSPDAPVAEEVEIPAGKRFIEADPKSTDVIITDCIASIETDA